MSVHSCARYVAVVKRTSYASDGSILYRGKWEYDKAGKRIKETNAYVLSRELCEEAVRPEKEQDANEDIWVWTVNGEEIGRSDKLSRSEIEDLLYNENSEWRLMDDRWRTIYNNGLMRDFSIYSEP